MVKSKVTSKGQITIPRDVREELGIHAGDVLEWDVQKSHVQIRLAGHKFMNRRGTIRIGPGSVVDDIKQARRIRGGDPSWTKS